MRTFSKYKNQAIELRKQSMTYAEIKNVLGVPIPKSTLSEWCHDIVLPAAYHERVVRLNKENFIKAQTKSHYMQREKFESSLERFTSENQILKSFIGDIGFLKVVLAILYLGEGAKRTKSHHNLSLGSSDPEIVSLYLALLEKCYGVLRSKLRCRICYRADQDINALQDFWSKNNNMPLKHFYKTKPDARTIGKPTLKPEYKGVCVVSGGGSQIQIELDVIARLIVKWVAKEES